MPPGVGVGNTLTLTVAGQATTYPALLAYARPVISYLASDLGPILGGQSLVIVGSGYVGVVFFHLNSSASSFRFFAQFWAFW